MDKAKTGDVIRAARKLRVKGSVRPGQLIAEDIGGSGAGLIATWKLNS